MDRSNRSDIEVRVESWVDALLCRSPAQPLFLWRAAHQLSVFAYHGIDDPESFRLHLDYISRHMHPVTQKEVADAIDGKTGLPKRAVLITFDDGDRSLLDFAMPMLRDRGIPGVAFVVASLLDSNTPYWWNEVKELVRNGGTLRAFRHDSPEELVRALKKVDDDQRLASIEELRMSAPRPAAPASQIRKTELLTLESAGIAIGNHSLTHCCFPRCSQDKIVQEISESHNILTAVLGRSPETFAYPNGDFDERARPVLNALGYGAAFLFDHRVSASPPPDRFLISRIRVNSTTTMDRFRIILSGLHPAIYHIRRTPEPPMRRLKILFVIDGLGQGGSERSISELLSFLKRVHIECIVVCLHERREGVQTEVQHLGFNIRFLKSKGWFARIRALRKIIRMEKPDVIHTTLFESNILGRLAGWGRAPVMSSLVNTQYDPVRFQDPGIRSGLLRIVQKIDSWTGRHLTTHFHAVSATAKQAGVNALGLKPERITVVERGRDPSRLGHPDTNRFREARMRLGLTEDQEVIVNVGRHEYQKGQCYLLEAMAQLLPGRPGLVLLIAGRHGTSTDDLVRFCDQQSLNGSVRFLGHREDVPEILAAADVFVFPSLYEGLPGAVIEAMALGLPVVASDIGPLRDAVEPDGNAILVSPRSSLELARAVQTLLEDRQKRITFGLRSREIFENRFLLERSASRMIDLYHHVAAMQK